MTAKQPAMDATRIGRSHVAKAPEFQELYECDANALTFVDAMFPYESAVHRAHVVMLAEEHILADDEAATILKGLRQVDAMAADDASLRTYLPYEAALIRTIGHVGGKMHIGRSRNDLANTVTRMFLRDQLLRVTAR
jgi:argininosuccinate lyase